MTHWLRKNITLLKSWPLFYWLYPDQLRSTPLTLRNGLKVFLWKRDDICILHEIFSDDAYDIGGLPEKSVVIDVGAHLGFFTLLVLHTYPKSRVIAVEASRNNYELLKRNVVENGFADRCTLIHGAMATTPGTQVLYLAGGGDSAHNSLKGDLGLPLEGTEEVDGVLLDDILGEIPHCDLLKIDIEGLELEVLESSKLLSKVGRIATEPYYQSKADDLL